MTRWFLFWICAISKCAPLDLVGTFRFHSSCNLSYAPLDNLIYECPIPLCEGSRLLTIESSSPLLCTAQTMTSTQDAESIMEGNGMKNEMRSYSAGLQQVVVINRITGRRNQ